MKRCRTVPFVVLFVLCSLTVSAETRTDVEATNAYGGRTVEVVYQEGDTNFGLLEASRLFYDQGGALMKSLSRLSAAKSSETGIAFREESYTRGVISGYKMFFTQEQQRVRGYESVTETVDAQDHVLSTTYGRGGKEVTDSETSFMKNYPFYTLRYTKSRLLEEYTRPAQGDAVTFSAKFNRGRAFVTFSGPIAPMTAADLKIAGYYFAARGIADGLQNYHQKIQVLEDGTAYTLYLQDGLLPYIADGNAALITYLDIGFNDEMYLLITGFIDIK